MRCGTWPLDVPSATSEASGVSFLSASPGQSLCFTSSFGSWLPSVLFRMVSCGGQLELLAFPRAGDVKLGEYF